MTQHGNCTLKADAHNTTMSKEKIALFYFYLEQPI